MAIRKHLLLFGAGKSATVLIDYMKEIATARDWQITIADGDLTAILSKTGEHPLMRAVQCDIRDDEARQTLVIDADVVISLLPPALHYQIALDCLNYKKDLLTASYVDEKIRALAPAIKAANLLFLCEMGLDPGIDHMSAMQLIHRIEKEGGVIRSFRSHCGGLVAPESDNNPWHYKISWNPRYVVLAGKSGAIYKEAGQVIQQSYEQLFDDCTLVDIPGLGTLAYYPNRDSLAYVETYALEKAHTFIRSTLRHADFCSGWNQLLQLKLTDEAEQYDTEGLLVKDFFSAHLAHYGLSSKIEKIEKHTALSEQLHFLGLYDATPINRGLCTAAEILQFLLEEKLVLQEHDRDMVVMLHEIDYETASGSIHTVNSSLIVKGKDHLRTAMATTVGLPLGIAAVQLLDGMIAEKGLHIPIIPSIYEPVLLALQEKGIKFQES